MITYDYNNWQFSDVVREGGHLIIKITTIADNDYKSSVDLILDTGAYITVVSRRTAKIAKLPLGTGKSATLQGFTGEHDPIAGELIEIPRIVVGKHFVDDVKVVVPLDDITIAEVLGENVLEYFNITIDHEKDVVYFKKNPVPKPYINAERGIDLSCGKVLLGSEAM